MKKHFSHNYQLLHSVLLILLAMFMLTSCGASQDAPSPMEEGPTVDPNLVFTSGAQTVVAQITIDAANRPVPTAALPPTQTPGTLPALGTPGGDIPPLAEGASTQVALPGAEVTLAAIPTLSGLATLAPLAGTTPLAAPIPDRLTWVKNVPPDESKVPAGKAFTITWTVQNTGTTTWTELYSYKHFAGTQFGKSAGYPITKDVAPNSTVNLSIDAVAPSTPGEYYSLWVLQNPDGVNFGKFDITLTVQ